MSEIDIGEQLKRIADSLEKLAWCVDDSHPMDQSEPNYTVFKTRGGQ